MSRLMSNSEHDDVVFIYALRLLSQGYVVHARVEGWFQDPQYVCGYSPDIIASKGKEYKIVEVIKGEVDWPKITALRQFASQNENITFEVFDLNERKSRGTNLGVPWPQYLR